MEKLAIILLLISLGLLLIYGIDVMVASQSETDAVTRRRRTRFPSTK